MLMGQNYAILSGFLTLGIKEICVKLIQKFSIVDQTSFPTICKYF